MLREYLILSPQKYTIGLKDFVNKARNKLLFSFLSFDSPNKKAPTEVEAIQNVVNF